MPAHSLIVPVVVRPDYQIGYEHADGVTFAHCTVTRWTHEVRKSLRDDFETALGLHGGPLYAVLDPARPRLPKFLRSFGFTPCGTVRDLTGRIVPIYERSLDGKHVRWWHH